MPEEDRILGISPGQALRIPIGFLFLAAFLVLAALFGTYVVAFNNGRSAAQREFDPYTTQADRDNQSTVNDPLNKQITGGSTGSRNPLANQTGQGPANGRGQSNPAGGNTRHNPNSDEQTRHADANTARAVMVTSRSDDPRQPGLNYPIVAFLSRDAAEDVARYLAANGISAARLPPNSRGNCSVVVLRGFTNPRSDPAADAFERDLKALGRLYKAEHNGPTNFSDLWWDRHD